MPYYEQLLTACNMLKLLDVDNKDYCFKYIYAFLELAKQLQSFVTQEISDDNKFRSLKNHYYNNNSVSGSNGLNNNTHTHTTNTNTNTMPTNNQQVYNDNQRN